MQSRRQTQSKERRGNGSPGRSREPDFESHREIEGPASSSRSDFGVKESPMEDEIEQSSDCNSGLDHDASGTLTSQTEPATTVELKTTVADQYQPLSAQSTLTRHETRWWAMSFEELHRHAVKKGYGKHGKESRKSGRVQIIRWLCRNEGITPYVAPVVATEATAPAAKRIVRPTGAISHPEAILRTSDPTLQRLIDESEGEYKKNWTAAALTALAMQRSYQLLKDSDGKLPSKSVSAMAHWLAGWDVLKSPREKNWWLGDGIDLVNRAKAMGYQGPSKKYDVIVWLRSTPEDAEIEVTQVAVPTPNRKPEHAKRKNEAHLPLSKRPAKGSKRPHGWTSSSFHYD